MTARRFGPVVHAAAAGDAVSMAIGAEGMGYDDFWIPDYLTLPLVEPFVLAAAVAQATSTIGIGTAVVLAPFRTSFQLAKAALSLDQLSNGRFSLGVGLGGLERDYEITGVDYRQRGALANETLDTTRRLLSSESVSYEGRYYRFQDLEFGPRSVQKRVPIWTGADGAQRLADGPLRRAALYADGFFPFLTSVREFERGQKIIRELAATNKRDPDAIQWGLHIWTCLGRDPADAAAIARRELSERFGAAWEWPVKPDLGYLLGSPADVVATLQSYADIGVTHFLIDPACAPAEQTRMLETFAKEVIPNFR